MKALLTAFTIVLEAIFFLCYPFIYLLLRRKNYLDAIHVKGFNTNRGVLFHAASMGEVAAVKPLILELLKSQPDQELCITTSTTTGLNQAKAISPKVKAFLSTLDIPHLRNRQLNLINPSLICIVETEIWPNMLAWSSKNRIPIVFVNARMTERSLHRYLPLKSFLRFLGKEIHSIYAQSEADASRYKQLFSKPVFVAGNLKITTRLTDYNAIELRKSWGYGQDDLILCWGSSRPGEEALLISLWPQLKTEIPNLKLIIAIRHPQRLSEVLPLLTNSSYCLYSLAESGKDILIIDKLGVLDQAYAICDLAIVGGSFYDFGGHNPLEPAYYAKAIIMGNFYATCEDSVKKLLEAKGILISDANSLGDDIIRVLNDTALRCKMGEMAKKVLTENSHSLETHLYAIESLMKRDA
jgi:3-deoxy-D-manno-octulosonic-acid transferase